MHGSMTVAMQADDGSVLIGISRQGHIQCHDPMHLTHSIHESKLQLDDAVERRGGFLYWAGQAAQAGDALEHVCQQHRARCSPGAPGLLLPHRLPGEVQARQTAGRLREKESCVQVTVVFRIA